MILYRPTNLKEPQLVAAADMRARPPRLADQPILYPVLTAEKIARGWNSTLAAPDNLGFVTKFGIIPEIAENYPAKIASGIAHTGLWVSAAELDTFNEGIVGKIEVVAPYKDRKSVPVESVWPANG